MQSQNTFCRIRTCCFLFRQQRYRYKKKWAVMKKTKSHSEKALDYFDSYYRPVYGDKWPSIRVSLLTRQKYCALVNNFSDAEDTSNEILASGGNDMLQIAANTLPCEVTRGRYTRVGKINQPKIVQEEDVEEPSLSNEYENIPGVVTPSSDLYEFVPPTKVLSASEEREEEEHELGFYRPKKMDVHVVPSESLTLPDHLKLFIHDRGEVDLFPDIRRDAGGKLSHFMMDAASILPVLALDLHADDHVLDLCSAPGGKALTMLQTMLPGQLICVDQSKSRLKSQKEMMKLYIPNYYTLDNRLDFVRTDGITYGADFAKNPIFDKVLVDVPCYTDRHMVNNDDNNLFKPSRRSERVEIQKIQKFLLCAAMKAVKPGGSIVYSTCTLAMPQNDGTIQAALEHIWQTTDIDMVVEDTCNIVDSFRTVFDFYPKCRFGQLVLPNLTANSGPMYFCKLKRIR